MRALALVLVIVGSVATAQPPPGSKRFGIDANLDRFPQTTPKDALRSAIKAMDEPRIDYLMAHLIEPAYVDGRLKDFNGQFDKVVAEASRKLNDDPESYKQLKRFLIDGQFETNGDDATAKLPTEKGRVCRFKKVNDRWYLDNKNRP